MELTERQLRILQAIITDYVKNAEPVGSRSIAKKYELGVSPATIRNEMADLEDLGYLTHPHTSAGRVPSDKAYRLYVNSLMSKPELSEQAKKAINERMQVNLAEFDETIRHAASLLSEITKLASFAMTPAANLDTLKFIRLLPVDESTIVLMIVSDSGNVTNTSLHTDAPYTPESLEIISKSMTYRYNGHTLDEVLRHTIIDDCSSDIETMGALAGSVMPNFMKTLEDMLNVNLYLEGLTNIFNIPEYNSMDRARSFLELVDRKEQFTRDMLERGDGLIVTIGEENTDTAMKDCSLITATYHVDGKLIGKIGVIGPTRMDYGGITSIMEYLTNNLSRSFMLGSGNRKDK